MVQANLYVLADLCLPALSSYRGVWGPQVVIKHVPSAQVTILGSWDLAHISLLGEQSRLFLPISRLFSVLFYVLFHLGSDWSGFFCSMEIYYFILYTRQQR